MVVVVRPSTPSSSKPSSYPLTPWSLSSLRSLVAPRTGRRRSAGLERVVIVVTVRWSRMEQLAVDAVDARWLSTADGRWRVCKCRVKWLRVCVCCVQWLCVCVCVCVCCALGLRSMCAEWGVKRGCGGLGRSRGLRPNDATSGREHARSRTHPVPTLHEDHLHGHHLGH
jgi:hypothetical protein